MWSGFVFAQKNSDVYTWKKKSKNWCRKNFHLEMYTSLIQCVTQMLE